MEVNRGYIMLYFVGLVVLLLISFFVICKVSEKSFKSWCSKKEREAKEDAAKLFNIERLSNDLYKKGFTGDVCYKGEGLH
jgi:hypothetical protein